MQGSHRLTALLSKTVAWTAARWGASLPGRVLGRYLSRNGPLMANGLAYGLLFAFSSGVWMAVSVLGMIMVGSVDWQRMLLDALRSFVPGVSDSLLSGEALNAMSATFTWTGLATLAMFWWTVTGWMDSLRAAARAMFDDCDDELNPIIVKLRDTLAAVAVVVLFILSTVAGTVSGGLVRRLLRMTGIRDGSLPGVLLLESTGFVTGLMLNLALFALLLRVVAHIRAGRFTLVAALLGAFVVSGMQLMGVRLLGGVSRNPMLAPFAAIVGALVWFNLVAQVILLCASLIAECRSGGRGA